MCQYKNRSPHSLHARFGSTRVTLPRRCQERVECGLEIALLGDAAFERPDLIGALEAAADVEFERRIRAGVPQRQAVRVDPRAATS